MLGAIASTTDEIVSQKRVLWQNLFGLTKPNGEIDKLYLRKDNEQPFMMRILV